MSEEEKQYVGIEYESVLEMLGGYTYFTSAQIMFVYLRLNGRDEESQKYLDEALQEANQINRNFYDKMKSPEELELTI